MWQVYDTYLPAGRLKHFPKQVRWFWRAVDGRQLKCSIFLYTQSRSSQLNEDSQTIIHSTHRQKLKATTRLNPLHRCYYPTQQNWRPPRGETPILGKLSLNEVVIMVGTVWVVSTEERRGSWDSNDKSRRRGRRRNLQREKRAAGDAKLCETKIWRWVEVDKCESAEKI